MRKLIKGKTVRLTGDLLETMQKEAQERGFTLVEYIRYLQEFSELKHMEKLLSIIKSTCLSYTVTPVQMVYLSLLKEYLASVDYLL